MKYPLQMSFKLLTISQQISVRDADGKLVFYVKQKAFRLKDAVTVFADEAQTRPLCDINAASMLDFSNSFLFTDRGGNKLGSVKRQGLKSLWKAHYDIQDGDSTVMTIQETNPWVKVIDGVLCEIPFVGLFSGYLFQPIYSVARPDGTAVMRLSKKAAFFESRFSIEELVSLSEIEELRVLLSLIMMVLLERYRK